MEVPRAEWAQFITEFSLLKEKRAMRTYGQNGVFSYSTVDELQRALLAQMRRFRRVVPARELAATFTLSGPGTKAPTTRRAKATPDVEKLDTLAQQLQILKNMVLQLKTQFVGQPRATQVLKSVQQFADLVQKQMDTHRRKVGADAEGQVSRGLKLAIGSTLTSVEKSLGRRNYAELNKGFLIAPVVPFRQTSGAVNAEVGYIRVRDLKGTDGFTHAQFFIVIATPLQQGSGTSRFWVATLTDYRTPSRVRWEAEAKNPNELRTIVADLMAQDGVLGRAFPREIPVPAGRVKFTHANVKDTKVTNNMITVTVKNKKLLKQTRDELLAELVAIVKTFDPKNRDAVRSAVNAGNGSIRFVFSLPNRLKGRIVPKDTLTRIKALLNLDDAELQRVKNALEDAD